MILAEFHALSVAVYVTTYVHTALKFGSVHVCTTGTTQSTASFAVIVGSVSGVHTVVVNVCVVELRTGGTVSASVFVVKTLEVSVTKLGLLVEAFSDVILVQTL